MGLLRLICAAALAVFIAIPLVQAHPHDTMSVKTAVKISDAEVGIELILSPPSEEGLALFEAIDTDSDGAISDAEGRIFGEAVLRYTILRIDSGTVVPTFVKMEASAFEDLSIGMGEIRIVARSGAAVTDSVAIKTAYRLDATHTINAFASGTVEIHSVDRSVPGFDLLAEIRRRSDQN